MPILPSCIRRLASPVAKDYRLASGQKHKVSDTESWVSLAKDKGM